MTENVTKNIHGNSSEAPHHLKNVTASKITHNELCPTCGQLVGQVRLGIKLPRMKARIFDLVQQRPGITNRELCTMMYASVDESSLVSTRAHINQLNIKLMGSGVQIEGTPGYGYRIVKERLEVPEVRRGE